MGQREIDAIRRGLRRPPTPPGGSAARSLGALAVRALEAVAGLTAAAAALCVGLCLVALALALLVTFASAFAVIVALGHAIGAKEAT